MDDPWRGSDLSNDLHTKVQRAAIFVFIKPGLSRARLRSAQSCMFQAAGDGKPWIKPPIDESECICNGVNP